MSKTKKISKKQELTLDTISKINLDKNKISTLKDVNPSVFFSNHNQVNAALLESLIENDTEAFIEIIDSYLRVNIS